MAQVKQVHITFDCADPLRVAEFWKALLGYVDPPPPQGFDSWDEFKDSLAPEAAGSAWLCVDPEGQGPRLYFQRVPEEKVVKNRVHLDVRVAPRLTGQDRLDVLHAEAARAVELGGKIVHLLPADEINESCMVMQDVEGNEFCLD